MDTYKVKDSEGEYIEVSAFKWECGGNGLKFYSKPATEGQELVAWFVSWQHFRKISDDS